MHAPHPDPAASAALRDDLIAAGYTADAIRSAWGPLADEAVGHGLTDPAVTALGTRADALAVLARLLFLGVAVDVVAAEAALPRCGVAGLAALRLAEVADGEVVPLVLVRPQDVDDEAGAGGWWIASDLDEAALIAQRRGSALPTDHVLGVGGASLTLAGLQLPSAVDRVLDIGTGCGIQALRARHHARRVVATDVSERALAFTRLNALLNDVDGIETRAGSLFDPVADGEEFDRVVSNPPFVITPRVAGVPEYEYRDAGYAGDDLISSFVAGVGRVLAPGGIAQLLGNWEYRAGSDGLDRVRTWVDSSPVPLEAWVIERERLDPLAYAELWVRDGGTTAGTSDYSRLVHAWLEDFAHREVSAVGFGYLVLRRPADGEPRLRRFERVGQPVTGALGPHLLAALDAWDRASSLDDTALAACSLVVAGDVTEARHHLPGHEDPSVIELRQGGGFARVIDVDPALAALVGACDGDLPVGALIDAIADLLEADAAALRTDLIPRVRELLFTGFLTFA